MNRLQLFLVLVPLSDELLDDVRGALVHLLRPLDHLLAAVHCAREQKAPENGGERGRKNLARVVQVFSVVKPSSV